MAASRRPPPRTRVARNLHSAALRLLRRLRRVDESLGISPARLSALSVLVFGTGELTIGELAAVEQVRAPTMTNLIQGLESAGLVERRPDPHDRRVVRVRPTAAGIEMLEVGRKRRVSALTEMMRDLTPGEVRTLSEAADIIQRMLQSGPT